MMVRGDRCLSWIAFCLLSLAPCHAEEPATRTVELFERAFLPQSIDVQLGDRVEFLWRDGEHIIASGLVDAEAGSPLAPGSFFEGVVNEQNPRLVWVVDASAVTASSEPGGVPFFDRLHPAQLGFLSVRGSEETFRVGVVDNAFLPTDVYLFAGDTVRWEHEPNEMFHTVTSGRSSAPEDRPGELFDEESSEAHPVFEYRFAGTGEYPYFCRPHEEMGMNGRIFVQELFVRGDADHDLVLTITDPIAVLAFLFAGESGGPCEDALDSDDDGVIGITDAVFVLNYLFLGGACVPPPFPRAGADRTDDPLLCRAASTI